MNMKLGNGVEGYFLLVRMIFSKIGYFLVSRILLVEEISSLVSQIQATVVS